MRIGVLIVGNFLSGWGLARGVCEELSVRLRAEGFGVIAASNYYNRILRILDMGWTAFNYRSRYGVAMIDVYSGPAFIWAEVVSWVVKALRKPLILVLHGGGLPQFSQDSPRRVRRLLNTADHRISPSAFLKRELSPLSDDIAIIPNPIQLSSYLYKARQSARPRLVWLRAFHEIYNPCLVPRSIKLLEEEFPQLEMTMIGPDKKDGSHGRVIREANRLGVVDRIHFVGAVPKGEVSSWLGGGDIFLNTSNVDNTPVSVIEAMACGLCVVSTDVGGLPDLIKNDETGLLVPPNNEVAMADAIRRILLNDGLAKQLSEGARREAERYDWGAVLPKWTSLIEGAAANAVCNSEEVTL